MRLLWLAVISLIAASPQLAAKDFDIAFLHHHNPYSRAFAKYTSVYDLPIYATAGVSNPQIQHVANVLAEYLDNDADGQVDNPAVLLAMQEAKAGLLLTHKPGDLEDIATRFPSLISGGHFLSLHHGQIQRENYDVFDETLVQTFRLIAQTGYAHVYPSVFGQFPGSQLANAMDNARAKTWFTPTVYDCDYGCMVDTYFYFGMTSHLDTQDAPKREQAIASVWQLNTPDKLKHQDTALYQLLTDPQYHLPQRKPRGRYRG